MTIDQVDDEWRRCVDEELGRRGWTKTRLAVRVGCDSTIIDALLRRGVATASKYAEPISRTLGIALPAERPSAPPKLSIVTPAPREPGFYWVRYTGSDLWRMAFVNDVLETWIVVDEFSMRRLLEHDIGECRPVVPPSTTAT